MIIQVAAIITSVLSLCLGFATFHQSVEEDVEWTRIDMAVDMVWNLLSISPRVIALALFASFQLYWFWGLIIAQVVIAIISLIMFLYFILKVGNVADIFIGCGFIGISSIFTMFTFFPTIFPIYLLYWAVMFIENTVMISLWHQWSDGLEFWYHDLALLYVIIAYVVSLIIKSVHLYFYKPNRDKSNIFKWKFMEV